MSKPENNYIRSVNKLLPPKLHFEKTNNPFRRGMADLWYSGLMSDLWTEYKWIEYLPNSTSISPALSPMQRRWLNARHSEGRVVSVILGTRDGGVIYTDLDWNNAFPTDVLRARLFPKRQVAEWIEGVVCTGRDVSWRPQR